MGGLGVALVSWPLSRHRFERGELVKVFDQEVDTGEHFYIAHRRNEASKPELKCLINWLIQAFGTDEFS